MLAVKRHGAAIAVNTAATVNPDRNLKLFTLCYNTSVERHDSETASARLHFKSGSPERFSAVACWDFFGVHSFLRLGTFSTPCVLLQIRSDGKRQRRSVKHVRHDAASEN